VDRYVQLLLGVSDKLPVGDNDARKRMLNHVASAASVGMTILGMLDLLDGGSPEVASRVLRVAKPEYADYARQDLLQGAKLHLLREAVFQYGHGLRSVLLVLDPDSRLSRLDPPMDILADVLVRSGLPGSRDKLDPLLVCMYLRDCLRADGVHFIRNGASETFEIDGVRYTFTHGHRVQCDSWDHLLHALTVLLRVVDEVVTISASRVPFVPDVRWMPQGGTELRAPPRPHQPPKLL
jgi:hypothetical protein